MPFKDSQEGQTHYENDGCGIKEHNKKVIKTCLSMSCPERKGGACTVTPWEKDSEDLLVEILAKMETCNTARECRHIIKEYILDDEQINKK